MKRARYVLREHTEPASHLPVVYNAHDIDGADPAVPGASAFEIDGAHSRLGMSICRIGGSEVSVVGLKIIFVSNEQLM